MTRLILLDPSGADRAVPLERTEFHIGREPDNDLVLADDTVSRHHARLVDTGHGWLLEDLGSANGTRVGRERITRKLLDPGEVFHIGVAAFQIEDPQVAAPPEAPSAFLMPPTVPRPTPLPPLPPPTFAPPPLPPMDAPAHPRSRMPYLLAALLGMLLGGALVAGYFLKVRRAAAAPARTPPGPAISPSSSGLADPGAELAAATLARSLAQGDLEGAMLQVDPAFRETLRRTFQSEPGRMQKTATALAARKLLRAEAQRAEYELDEDGRTYTLVFCRTSGTWLLGAW